MCLLRLKKNNYWIAYLLLIATTSCGKFFSCCNQIEIPCLWHTPIKDDFNEEDPACYHWWEAFGDPLLTELIEKGVANNFDVRLAATQSKDKSLQAANAVAANIARNYIELWGWQERLKILHQQIECQKETFILTQGLSQAGFADDLEKNENKNLLDLLYMEQSSTELALQKTIFHISTLLNYAPADQYTLLYFSQKRLTLPTYMPLGNPRELVERHPGIREAKKEYELWGNSKAFYNYEKMILTVLEDAEIALAALQKDSEKFKHLMDRKKIKEEAFQLTKDLYHRGLKGDKDVQVTLQDLLSVEKAWIEASVQLFSDYVNLYQALSGGCEIDCRSGHSPFHGLLRP